MVDSYDINAQTIGGGPGDAGGLNPFGLLSGGGKIMKAVGSLYSGFEQSRSLQAQAEAKTKQAGAVREEGLWTAERLNEETRRTLAAQRELYGEAGVTLEGAPTNLMRDSKRVSLLNRLLLGRNVKQQSDALLFDADQLRQAAQAAETSGMLGAFAAFF
jgi:hypothetical protein